MSVCCIKECNEKVAVLGLCNKHYRRNKLYGSPVAMRNFGSRWLSAEERFWPRVKKARGCWAWMGGKDRDGYGVVSGRVNGESVRTAHRLSYAINKGPLNGMMVMHSCDNPSCVNPAHLFLGTNAENQRDKWARGRGRVVRGELAGHAILTEDQAKAILRDPRPYTQIATDYGIATSTVGSIKQRVSWSHLNVKPVIVPKAGRVLEHPRNAKLSKEQVREIRDSSDDAASLSAKHGISVQSITDIRKRRTWKHV